MVTVPLALPVAIGLKTAVMVQLAPGATLDSQVLRAWKGPFSLIEEIDNAAVPVWSESRFAESWWCRQAGRGSSARLAARS
jgi:hypothetical protein